MATKKTAAKKSTKPAAKKPVKKSKKPLTPQKAKSMRGLAAKRAAVARMRREREQQEAALPACLPEPTRLRRSGYLDPHADSFVVREMERVYADCPKPHEVHTNLGKVKVATPWSAAACYCAGMTHDCEIIEMLSRAGILYTSFGEVAKPENITNAELLQGLLDAGARMMAALQTDNIMDVYQTQTHVLMLSQLLAGRNAVAAVRDVPISDMPAHKHEVN